MVRWESRVADLPWWYQEASLWVSLSWASSRWPPLRGARPEGHIVLSEKPFC